MNKIKTIGLVAPSGNIRDFDEINQKIHVLQKNFKVKKFYGETSNGYLSDSDENRTRYFEQAFVDDETDLIISVRGGYGAIRIVDYINYDLIENSDKVYLGSSDATILLAGLYHKTKIKCFHGLMITNGFVENFAKNIDIIENNTFDIAIEPIKKGYADGILWGGNLSSLVSLLTNNKYIPDKNIILFLEDLNEPLYKIDKMLYEIYRNNNLKEKIKGILFGDFYFGKKEIYPLLKEYSEIFNVPSGISMDITHKENNITIPYGYKIQLDL